MQKIFLIGLRGRVRNHLRGERQEYWQKYSCTSFAQAPPWESLRRNLTRSLAPSGSAVLLGP